jgi:hypothetical protein
MDIDKTIKGLELMRVSVPLKGEVKLRNAIKLIEQLRDENKILKTTKGWDKEYHAEMDKVTERELKSLQEKYDKLNVRVELWKRIAEIRQYRNELNLHFILGLNEDALDSELYSLNLEEGKLLSVLTPEEKEMNDE